MRAIRILMAAAIVAGTMGLVSAAAFGLESDQQPQDGQTYALRGLNLAADSGSPATEPPDPLTCVFAGTWTGGYFPGERVMIQADVHSGFTDWMVSPPFGFGANHEDFEYVFVNRSTGKTMRTAAIAHVYPTEADLAAGLDIYLCYRPRVDSIPEPEPEVISIEPLTIRITPPQGVTLTGNMLVVPAPGIAAFAPGSIPVALDGDASAPVIIETGTTFLTVPAILPQLFSANAGGAGHEFTPLAIAPVPNDRVGFVWTVTPNETLWRPIFRLSIDGAAQPFDFPGPRIFNAGDAQIITLNLPEQLVPEGTSLDDVQLSIPASSPLNEAPPPADIFQRGPNLIIQGGGGNDTLTIQSTLYNPTDNPLTLTNDSIGVALTNCETGVPFTTMRATLDLTIEPRSNTLINYSFEDRIDIGPPLPEPPDPLSPTFLADLDEWFGEICVQAESRPALTLP